MASLQPQRQKASSPPSSSKQRRGSTALSCAECRRLKLRCNRVFPCTGCVKKGCAAICPDGSLTTGKGNRFILANTEVLHDKIGQLSSRVRQLEDALADTYGLHSAERHPLLSDDLLQIKRPLEREPHKEIAEASEATASESENIDAVGSLSISETGRSNFFGCTANAWYLLQNEEPRDEEGTSRPELGLPNDLPWLSHAFPFTSSVKASSQNVRETLMGCLPDPLEARRLADIYYNNAAWMYRPIWEEDFRDVILTPIYDPQQSSNTGPSMSQKLSVLFLVMSMGVLMDLDRPPNSNDAHYYFQLGRAALALDSIFEDQSLTALQALLLMLHFMFLSDIDGPRWAFMGMIVKITHSCGLHRDSGKWKLSPEETQKRRALFWEIYTYDSWMSLTYGRPPSFSLTHMDCRMAYEATQNAEGEEDYGFHLWKHKFCSQCLSIVHDQAFGAKMPSYKLTQELDRRVRNFKTPPTLRVPGFGGPMSEIEPPSPALTMQRFIAFSIREITIFYMHRGFFAHAMNTNPEDPLASKYAPSVLAAYSSACSFIGLSKSLFSQQPGLMERMWFMFTHVFSCAIVLASLPIRCPSIMLARSALSHLESALGLFEQVAKNPRAAKVLPVLRTQREKAIASMQDVQPRNPVILSRTGLPESPKIKQEDDQLTKLGGGQTRLVMHRPSSMPSSPTNPPSIAAPGVVVPRTSPPTVYSSPRLPTPPAMDFDSHWVGAGYADPPPSYDYTNSAPPPDVWSNPELAQQAFELATHVSPLTMTNIHDQFTQSAFNHAMSASPYRSGTAPQTPPADFVDAWASFMAQYGRV